MMPEGKLFFIGSTFITQTFIMCKELMQFIVLSTAARAGNNQEVKFFLVYVGG